MKKTSYKIALGGVVSSLCLMCMFLTGVFPLLMYALPAIAGVLMIVIVIDIGVKWAYTTYVAVALLSLLISPDKEAAVMFTFFFGFYPILKSTLEKIKLRPIEYLAKFAVFNASIITAFYIITYLFGITDMLEEFGEYGKYGALIMLAVGNGVFVIYDIALTRLVSTYINWFRPKILRKKR